MRYRIFAGAIIMFTVSICWLNVSNAETNYILDHWEVVVAEEWGWGEGGMNILQQWDNIGPGVRSFSWSGEAQGGDRNAFGNIKVSLPGIIQSNEWFNSVDISIQGQATVKVGSSESAFLRVGATCYSSTFNGYGPCTWEAQDLLQNTGTDTLNLIARKTGSSGGPGWAVPPSISFMATAGARGRLGGYIQDIQNWTIRAIAWYRQISSSEPNSVEADHEDTPVQLSSDYQNPVVIVGVPTYHDPEPGVPRLKNIETNSFRLRFQEWNYLDGVHGHEVMPYLVFEKGVVDLDDGCQLEVGSFEIGGTGNWKPVSFQKPFPERPYLFLTIQTANGPEAVTTRARNVSTTGFQAALFEEEALMGHEVETIGYLAIYSPKNWGELEINGRRTPYALQRIEADSRFIPILSSHLKLEEEQSQDDEMAHVDETVDVLFVKENLFGQIVSMNSTETVSLRRLAPEYEGNIEWGLVHNVDQKWLQVPLAKTYSNPIVVAKPSSVNDLQPGVLRLQGISEDRFQIRYQEWDYLDSVHGKEDVFYLVSEMGKQAVAGLDLEAWQIDTTAHLGPEGWKQVAFETEFSQAPVVLSALQTFNNSDAVTTRIRNLDLSSFELAMSKQESASGSPSMETIGWIAISQGYGISSDGRAIASQILGNAFQSITLNFIPFDRRYPTVVADVVSANELDPLFIRYFEPQAASMQLYMQEEKSLDIEVVHANESISLFLAGHPIADQLPVANAGPDQEVSSKSEVELDGSASFDPDGEITSYRWTQISGNSVALDKADTKNAAFTAPSCKAQLKFELTVMDNSGNASVDVVVVRVFGLRTMPWLPLLLLSN